LARIIAVASGKGGVGKTTIALNIGTVLAKHFKKSVTLIDCNVTTSHLGMYIGMYYSPATLNKALRGEVPMKEAVYHHFGGMKVIPASLSLSDLEGVDVTKLRDKIETISDDNEIILLDGAPGLGREAIAALKAADEVLFVTTPYVPAVMDIVRTMEVVNEVGIRPIGIILNMVDKQKYEMTPQEVEQLTRVPVIGVVPFDKTVNRSLVEKLPVVIFRPDSKVSKAFVGLGANLIGQHYEEKSGIFHRIANVLRRRKSMELPSALLGPDMESMQNRMELSDIDIATHATRFPSPNTTFNPAIRPSVQSTTYRPGLPQPELTKPEPPSPDTTMPESDEELNEE
jgi:septum site-determining protein MinD